MIRTRNRRRQAARKNRCNPLLRGLPRARRLAIEPLEARRLLALDLTEGLTEIVPVDSLELVPDDRTLIEIGGPEPGNPDLGDENNIDGYDQIRVSGDASLDGTLEVRLVNDYLPDVGSTFDFLTLTDGDLSGQFAHAEGLFSFPGGDRYFDIVPNGNWLQLEVKAAPGGLLYDPPDATSKDEFGEFLSDYFNVTQFSYTGDLSVGGFASFSGSLSFEESGGETLVAASGVNVQLGSTTTGVQITGASFGLLLPGDGTYALKATGDGALTGIPNFTLSGTMLAERNTTGADVDRTITFGEGSVTIDVASNARRFADTGLGLNVAGFVSVSGDVGFDLSDDDLIAVADNVKATLTGGDLFSVGVVGGSLGLVATAEDTTALEVRGGVWLSGGGFASVTADAVTVQYNETGLAYTGQTIAVGEVSHTFGDIPASTTLKAVSVQNLQAEFGGAFHLAGDLAFESEDATDGDNLTTREITVGASGVDVFLGANRGTADETGVRVDAAKLGLVLRSTKVAGEDWNPATYAMVAEGDASLVGVDGLTLSGSLAAQVNRMGAPVNETITTPGGDVEIQFDSADDVTQLEGTVTLGIDGFVHVSGSMAFRKGDTAMATLSDGLEKEVSVVTVGASDVDIFVGVNGPADADGAAGLSVQDAAFALALLKPVDELDTSSYYGLRASASAVSLVGLDFLTLEVNGLEVLVNGGSDSAPPDTAIPVVDFTKFEGGSLAVATGPTSSLEIDFAERLVEASTDDALLSISDFVYLQGGFAFTRKPEMTVTLADGTPKSVQVTTFGFESLDAFVGSGPYFTGDGTTNPDAAGLLLNDITLALALFKPTDTDDAGSYYAVSASAESIELPGLDLAGSDTFSLDASGYRIEVSGGTDGTAPQAIDFGKLPEGKFTVPIGAGSVDFDYNAALLRVAIDNATLTIGDYVYASGGLSFTKQDAVTVKLSDGLEPGVEVNVLAFGAGSVDLFVGDGPYFEDSDEDGDIDGFDARAEDAVGLALENVNFGLIVMRPTAEAHRSKKYMALKATANYAGLVGVDVLKLSGSDIEVAYNTVKNPDNPNDTTVVDFSQMTGGNYSFDTGNGELDIDYSSKLLRASVGQAVLEIDEYVQVRGAFAFEKGANQKVTLSDTSATEVDVSAINVGAQDVTMFFGVNGPYWTDLDRDGDVSWALPDGGTFDQDVTINAGSFAAGASTTGIKLTEDDPTVTVDGVDYGDLNEDGEVDPNETAELNEDAVGLAITNADLALALFKPTSSPATKYLAVHATADHVGFVGTHVFKLEASTVAVDLNLATGLGVTASSPVVDFDASFNELRELFDAEHNGIRVGELRTLAGQALDGAYTGLYESTDADTLEVSLTSIVSALDTGDGAGGDPDGLLQVSEAQIFLADANDNLAQTVDSDGDGKLDTGYEIQTGGDPLYLNQSRRRIYASADNVLVNVAEFVYLNGSVALDLGSREMVTINTGIPSDLGSLASGAVAPINTALGDLSAQLATLKNSIRDAIQSAINTVRATINSQVNSIVDTIYDEVTSTLDDAKGAVEGFLTQQLGSATDGLGASLLDPLIDEVIDFLPGDLDSGLQSLVTQLLSPIRERLTAVFEETLQEAMSGAIEKIKGSVSQAMDAGLQQAGEAEDLIKTAIEDAIQPQIDLVLAKLDQLISKVEDKLAPVFDRLAAIAGIVIGENFATIENVEVDVTAIGISNATAFVGMPPTNELDWTDDNGDGELDTSLADQGAIGLFVRNFNMGLGLFKPSLSKQLPSFTAAKISADEAGFADGGAGILDLSAKEIEVKLNVGGPIIKGAGALLGSATIDFPASFPATGGYAVQTGTTTDPIYLDFDSEYILASVGRASLTVSEFVHVTGSVAFEKGAKETVNVTGGLLTDAAQSFLDELEIPEGVSIPATGATETELSFMTVGASNVHAFVGMGGPYWTDLNGDRNIGWTLPDHGTFHEPVTIGGIDYHAGDSTTAITLTAADPVVTVNNVKRGDTTVDGIQYGDLDGDEEVDADETAELNEEAVGLVINDFDFGMAVMKPTDSLDFAKYFSLKASADSIELVGIEDVTVAAKNILVEVNQSSPSIYGLPLFPVVDFAGTPRFADERLALFDTDGDGKVTVGELRVLHGDTEHDGTSFSTDVGELYSTSTSASEKIELDRIMEVLDTDFDGILTVTEAAVLASRVVDPDSGKTAAADADADGDGKIDPLGFEVNTGGEPVYLSMDSSVIRAQGLLELDLFGVLVLNGSIAFELGPTEEVTLSNGDTKTVTTMTVGAANVTAFVGYNGPYWTDLDGDHAVSWSDANGNPLTQQEADTDGDYVVDADETAELNEDAIGLAITDLDLGLMLMASTNPADLGVYLAAKASVHSFGFVGIDQVVVEGTFDIALNMGIGMEVATGNPAVVDFLASFPDTNGFEVNTGDPDSPVLLDFDQFLISFQLGGMVTIYTDDQQENPVFRLNGMALFETDETGLSLFVAAGLEFGPDIGSDDKYFDMNALGGLVINDAGIAADIDVSVAIGSGLSSSMSVGASLSARVIFNTTEAEQSITIPAKYVPFLEGTVDLGAFASIAENGGNVDALQGLTGDLDERFEENDDGSATFTISGIAPTLAQLFPDAELEDKSTPLSAPGPYFAVAIDAELRINGNWNLDGRFGLIVADAGFEMSAEANLHLGSLEVYVNAYVAIFVSARHKHC